MQLKSTARLKKRDICLIKSDQNLPVENILFFCDCTKYFLLETQTEVKPAFWFLPTAKYKRKAASVPQRLLPSREMYSWQRKTKHTGKQREIIEGNKKHES